MRITIDPLNKDYIAPENRRGIKVFLNGVEQRGVYFADENIGQIIKAKTDKSGKLIAINGEIQFVTINGNVKIITQP